MSKSYNWLLIKLWPLAFLMLGTTWLWAPQLNHFLSYRTTLISQYETSIQPYSWVFRLCDAISAILLILAAYAIGKIPKIQKLPVVLLTIVGVGMLLDPIFASECRFEIASCREHISLTFLIHALETAVTATAIFALTFYDSWQRRRVVSISFLFFQACYGLLLVSQLATHNHFNTISQYSYQLICQVWLAWYVYGYLEQLQSKKIIIVPIRYAVAAWAFINGVLAVILSLGHINLLGRFKIIYFAGDNAWLAEHGVVIGIILIYISRQLWRGEQRARQIFMAICGLEVIKYSLITPDKILVLYWLTFCVLMAVDEPFYRGTIALTWRRRLKEAAFMTASLLLVALVALSIFQLDSRRATIAADALDNFFDFSFSSKVIPTHYIPSILLDNTISVFLFFGSAMILWILFRPSKLHLPDKQNNQQQIKRLLDRYSTVPDDYFKLWPQDKHFFWGKDNNSFIAYKVAGSISYALAEPIGPNKKQLIQSFVGHNQRHRFNTCFLPVSQANLANYTSLGLNTAQIGANALIDIQQFTAITSKDKWWRWQKNRAQKAGYTYKSSLPPHSKEFIDQLKPVSDSWLKKGNHKERCFSLGYFSKSYLQNCRVDYLVDSNNQIVAFTNLLPNLNHQKTASIDLLRYRADANNAMPYLLLNTIEQLAAEGNYTNFDLGFVPFVSSTDPIVVLAKTLSRGRFSAKGLEQFKNKFDPIWQPSFLAYDGDIADFAQIAINLERMMEIND